MITHFIPSVWWAMMPDRERQTMRKQYKGTDSKMVCSGHQFVLGETYSIPEEQDLRLCHCGFHACDTVLQVFNHYSPANSRIFECEASCDIVSGDKNCSRTIRLVRELSFYEVMRLANCRSDGNPFEPGKENTNTGFGNHGNNNYGNNNHGNNNYGNYNRGNYNLGNYNHGNYNR